MFLQQSFNNRHELRSVTLENGKRFYEAPEGEIYPSVTTILGNCPWLDKDPGWKAKWIAKVGEVEAHRVSERALARGRLIHKVSEKYLANDPSWDEKLLSYARMDFARIRPILDKRITKVYGSELAVWSHRLRTAGRTDLICDWEGEPVTLDFKTSSRIKTRDDIWSYFVQATAYSKMVDEIYWLNTESVVIVMLVDHDAPIVFKERVRDWIPLLDRAFVTERPEICAPSSLSFS